MIEIRNDIPCPVQRPTHITIYGVFDESGVCLYVGRTGNLAQRTRGHRRRFPNGKVRAFRVVEADRAPASESRTIRYYVRKGQAQANVNGRKGTK